MEKRTSAFIAFALIVLATAVAVAADGPPLALIVEVEGLGRGVDGTVVGVLIQIAPEDADRAGDRIRVTTTLRHQSTLLDRQAAVVELEPDGSSLLYREWPVGHHTLEVAVASIENSARGGWAGDIEVPEMTADFESPEDAPVEALALTPMRPATEGVRFEAPPDRGGIGALQLEVKVPEQTATVDFSQDGSRIMRRNRAPWTCSVNLGTIIRRTRIRAVARDAKGRYLGEDALVLNNPTGQIGVEILTAPDDAVVDGRRPVTVAVTGGQEQIVQVSLSLDDRQVARWAGCPCRVEIPIEELESATILSAEAVGIKGNRGDAVVALGGNQGSFSGSVKVELVEVPVTVLDGTGAPIVGLPETAFQISEDGRPVNIEGFGTTEDTPLSLALAVDTSGSMQEQYDRVLTAVRRFASDLMSEGDEVVVLSFAWEATVRLPWTEDAGAIQGQLDRIVPEGGTSLHDAVVRSLEQFRGRRGRQALVLLTDGEDTTSRTGWDLAKRFAHTMRVPIYPIGLGLGRFNFSARKTLERLAEETGGEAFFPKHVDELGRTYARIGELLRSQYLIWYSSDSAKDETQFREITVTIPDHGDAVIRTIRGYYPGK